VWVGVIAHADTAEVWVGAIAHADTVEVWVGAIAHADTVEVWVGAIAHADTAGCGAWRVNGESGEGVSCEVQGTLREEGCKRPICGTDTGGGKARAACPVGGESRIHPLAALVTYASIIKAVEAEYLEHAFGS
jgi:hypothetical protein